MTNWSEKCGGCCGILRYCMVFVLVFTVLSLVSGGENVTEYVLVVATYAYLETFLELVL